MPSWPRHILLMLRVLCLLFALAVGYGTPQSALAQTTQGTWIALSPPAPRKEHVAVFDPVRDRMIVIGGLRSDLNEFAYLNDVWELRFQGSVHWRTIKVSGPPPSLRRGHSAIYDPIEDRVIVFGGLWEEYTPTNPIIPHFRNDVWQLTLSGNPTWSQIAVSGTPPSGRFDHIATFDSLNRRMIVFSGENSGRLNDVWSLSLTGTPTWTELQPLGIEPSPRSGSAAVYAPWLDKIVVFGGYDGAFRNDLWSLSLSGQPAWESIGALGTPPVGRSQHGLALDPEDSRVIMFGGEASSYGNDVWSLSFDGITPTWSQASFSGDEPYSRSRCSLVYDSIRHRMVVFGGYAGGNQFLKYRNDTWLLTLGSTMMWSVLFPSFGSFTASDPPVGRHGAAAFFDMARDRLLVWGGTGLGGTSNELWSFTFDTFSHWTRLLTLDTNGFLKRYHTAFVHDSSRDRMLMIAGELGCFSPGCFRNDVWSLSLSGTTDWTQLSPGGVLPSTRYSHSGVYDPVRDRAVIFGGHPGTWSNVDPLNDTWSLDLQNGPQWIELAPLGDKPARRYGHSAIYDPVGDRMIIFGGETKLPNSSEVLNDTWSLSFSGAPTWTRMQTLGPTPSERFKHTAMYDPIGDRMLICGGTTYGGISSDVWALNIRSPVPTWIQLSPNGVPSPARSDHAVAYDNVRKRMLISWGGYGSPDNLNDVWALELNDQTTGVPELPPSLGTNVCYPNPFQLLSTVQYSLETESNVTVTVFDLQGKPVRKLFDSRQVPGVHTVDWDGKTDNGARATSGLYLVRVQTKKEFTTSKVILAR